MKKLLLSFVLLALSSARLWAVNPVPFTEGVDFSFKINGTGTSIMTVYDETGSPNIMATSSGSWLESGTGTAWLRPGKVYNIDFWGLGPPDYTFSFVAPIGYTVYINGVAADITGASPGSGWFLHYHTVEIRPQGADIGGMWGSFSGISQGKSITWSVGLGDLRTGRSAGGILFKELDLANSPSSRARLYYAAPPSNVGQIVVIKDGPSNQTLRQIVTPIGFTDIVDVSGGYEIRCYFWGQVSLWNGIVYSFTGTPWKTIKVESPANNQLKITESDGTSSPVVRVSLLTGSGSTTATGGSISYIGSYTIHAFTSSGTFTPGSGLTSVDHLVVGGGGGGGDAVTQHFSGGGGGGGSVTYTTGSSVTPSTGYTVTIGAGGAHGANGSNSSFNGTTAYGGGHGQSSNAAPTSGGSGGGGGVNQGGAAAGSGSNVYGGGTGDNGGSAWQGGGGGGAGGAGGGLSTGGHFNGGVGLSHSISGTATYYGGGGGGGTGNGANPTTGGSGGGGGNPNGQGGTSGTANTGGGGGGAGYDNLSGTPWNGGAGGAGVVIVRYPSPTMTWTLKEGDSSVNSSNDTGTVRTTIHTSTFPASGQRDDVVEVRTGGTSGTIVAKTKFHYVTKAWGEELDSVIADPDTAALTTSYDYYTTSTDLGNYRRVKSVTAPTGNWTAYEYYDDYNRRGRVKYQFQPWLDSPSTASSASTTTGRVLSYDYAADWTGRYTRPTLREERINNVLTGKTTWSHGDNTGSGEPREYATINTYRDASNYHTDYTETYRADADPDLVGRLYKASGANLAQVSGSVSRGTFNTTTKAFVVGSSDDHWRELRFNGSTSSSGATSVTAFDNQSCPAVYMIANKSTLDVTIRIAQGYVYRTEKWIYTGSGGTDGFHLMSYEDCEFDAVGYLFQRWASNGALASSTHTKGRLTNTFGVDGIETQFTYDGVGRVLTSVKKGVASAGGYAAQGDITTTNTYDGANRLTQQVVSGSSLSLTSSSVYDLAGRLDSSTAPGGYTTSYDYTIGPRTTKVTAPGGAYQTAETYYDGQPKSLTGTAVVAQATTFARDGTSGLITRTVKFGGSTTALVATTADWLGRPITEVKPGGTGSGDATSSWFYNGYNQLYKVSRTGLADTLYTYDTLGGLVLEGLDIGANGSLDLASSDRITDHAWTFFTSSSNWWRRETTSTYATTSSGTATQTGKIEAQLSGLPTDRLSRTDSYDIFGNVTSQVVHVNRGGKTLTTTTDVADSSTDAVQIAYNGLLVSSQDTAGITMTYGYDALGRPTTSVDSRTGTTTSAYVTGTSQVSTVTDPANVAQATYTYDSAGRVSSVKDALNKYAYTSYTTRGEVYRQWADTTYPVEYGYDNWGRQTTMKTYRAGTGWSGSTWPASPGTADTTTWAFHEPTGLLASKTDASGEVVSYTYTQAGQIDVRTWARGVTTDYGYSSTTGELLTVDYSDSTTDLTYTYNRLGQSATVVDVTGTRTLNYNLAGTLEMQSEDLPSFFGTRRVTYPRATAGVIGRPTGLQLGTSGSPTADQSITYGYASDGRLNSLAGGSQTFAYTYASNSHLVATVTNSAANFTDTRAYDSTHNWTDSRTTTISSTNKAAFAYAQDNLGRATSVARTGEVFNRYGNGTEGLTTYYGYDDRSQLTSEVTKVGTGSTVLTGRNDSSYAYDTIGNRSTVTHNGNTATYTSDLLNQYTQRTVPGVFDVAGAAGSGATVTVNSSGTGVTRHGEYFFKGHALSNNPNPVFSTLAVSDGTTTTNLPAFLAGTPEPFSYDDDGNLLSDGRWDYTYDAENRLVSVQTHTALSPSPLANTEARRIEFKHDYLGRRMQKTVRDGWNGSTFATVISDEKFVYAGWSAIARLNALSSNALVASYYWGLDLSVSIGGAGGVGGLLMVQEGGNTYLPAYDALGNVHAMIKASDGSIAAAYEYDAFGTTLRESGPYAASNPFRFATKYIDVETGLVYHDTRYYSPSLGRFLNRDSIGEQGGLNLYAYVNNRVPNAWDYLGHISVDHYVGNRVSEENFVKYGDRVNLRAMYDALDSLVSFDNHYGEGESDGTTESYRVTYADGTTKVVNADGYANAVSSANTLTNSFQMPIATGYVTASIATNIAQSLDVRYEGDVSNDAKHDTQFAIGSVIAFGGSYGQDVANSIAFEGGLTVQFAINSIPAGDNDTRTIRLDPIAPSFVGSIAYTTFGLPRSEVPEGLYGGTVVVAHELGHALFNYDDPFTYYGAHENIPAEWRPTYVPASQNVLTYENEVRDGVGLEPRKDYHGLPGLLL